MSFSTFNSFSNMNMKGNLKIIALGVNSNRLVYFPFNTSDICGNDLTNYGTNGINGKLGGTSNPTIVTTSNQKSYINSGNMYFNGSQLQYFNIPNLTLPSTGFSIACWFNYSSLEQFRRIFDFCNGSINSSQLLVCNYSGSNNIFLQNVVSGKSYQGPALITGSWYHFVWSISATGVWTMYLNNVKYVTDVTSYPTVLTYSQAFVGRASNESDHPTEDMNGYIDEFQIFNAPLTDEQVSLLYSS
jgi:hypothetical protein